MVEPRRSTGRRFGLRHKLFVTAVAGSLAVVPAVVLRNDDSAGNETTRSAHDVPLGGTNPRGPDRISVDGSLPEPPDPEDLGVVTDPPEPGPLGIPATALAAYRNAARIVGAEFPGCNIDWALIASIGRTESNHARGGYVDAEGDTLEPILGPVLNGSGNVAAILDTDGGRLDGDTGWDRAVGPTQFIPATWARHGADGNSDGRRDPDNLFDATVATARYLCSGGLDLANGDQLRAALYRYNNSRSYVETVIRWAEAYRDGVLPQPDSDVPLGVPSVPTREAPSPVPPPSRPAPVPPGTPPPVLALPRPPAGTLPGDDGLGRAPGMSRPSGTQPGVTPPGATPPGVTRPGGTPPEIAPPGTTSPGTTPSETSPSGTTPPETTPPVPTPPTTPPGTTPPGTTPPGTSPPGSTPPETTPPGTTPPGTQPPGTTPPGEQPPSSQPPGATPPGTQPPGTTQPPGSRPPGSQPPGTTPPPGTTDPPEPPECETPTPETPAPPNTPQPVPPQPAPPKPPPPDVARPTQPVPADDARPPGCEPEEPIEPASAPHAPAASPASVPGVITATRSIR